MALFLLSLCPFDISVGGGAFVIGLGQISSFLSLIKIISIPGGGGFPRRSSGAPLRVLSELYGDPRPSFRAVSCFVCGLLFGCCSMSDGLSCCCYWCSIHAVNVCFIIYV